MARSMSLRLTRILTAAAGICTIGWAALVIPVYRVEAELRNSAFRILAGDKFTPEQLGLLTHEVAAPFATSLDSLSLGDLAIIRVRLAETALQSGNAQSSHAALDDVQTAVTEGLAGNPNASFLWLTQYWLERGRAGSPASGQKFLRMSYQLGPNEAWIAVRRNPVALSAYSWLSQDLAEAAITEFAGLVSSGAYEQAADIFAGSGEAVRDKLLARLAMVNREDRRQFARILASKGLDDVEIPGFDRRPSQPF